jgi:hypothetical protein
VAHSFSLLLSSGRPGGPQSRTPNKGKASDTSIKPRHSTPEAAATGSNSNRILVPVGIPCQEQVSAQVRTIKKTYRRVGLRFAAWWEALRQEQRRGFLQVR